MTGAPTSAEEVVLRHLPLDEVGLDGDVVCSRCRSCSRVAVAVAGDEDAGCEPGVGQCRASASGWPGRGWADDQGDRAAPSASTPHPVFLSNWVCLAIVAGSPPAPRRDRLRRAGRLLERRTRSARRGLSTATLRRRRAHRRQRNSSTALSRAAVPGVARRCRCRRQPEQPATRRHPTARAQVVGEQDRVCRACRPAPRAPCRWPARASGRGRCWSSAAAGRPLEEAAGMAAIAGSTESPRRGPGRGLDTVGDVGPQGGLEFLAPGQAGLAEAGVRARRRRRGRTG